MYLKHTKALRLGVITTVVTETWLDQLSLSTVSCVIILSVETDITINSDNDKSSDRLILVYSISLH
jgi:hypothetical protein